MFEKARAALVAGLVLAGTVGACQSEDPPRCTWQGSWFDIWGQCPGAPPTGCFAQDADGRIAIDASAAWPARNREPAPLEPARIAEACAVLATCQNFAFESVRSQPLTERTPETVLASCLQGGLDGYSTEERAIPIDGYDERLSFLLRAVLDAHGDCAAIQSMLTRSTIDRECQEDGCWVNGERPEVTCQGNVAVFGDGRRRDCSRSYTRCSTTSATGCTDRPLLGCAQGARDRCDGDVKLGCDSCGYVTFRDCGWNGGRCVETADGARCADAADACRGADRACDGERLSLCVGGERQDVDCAALGGRCESRTIVVPIERDAEGLPSLPREPSSDPDEANCRIAAIFAPLVPGGVDAYECRLARCVRP